MSKFNTVLRKARVFVACLAVGLLGLNLSACSPIISKNGDQVTIDTNALRLNSSAILVAAQNILEIPALKQRLTAEQAQQLSDYLADIKAGTASIAETSDGAITLDVGKKWASQLSSELQQILKIATPIVANYDPTAATYLSYAQQLISIVQVAFNLPTTAAPLLTTGGAQGLVVNAPVENASVVRAKIFLGPKAAAAQ